MAYTEGRKKANSKWDRTNLDRMSIALPAGTKARIAAAAEVSGDSLNGWIKHVILERLDIVEGRELEQD
ncbi:hypothetical protein [Flavonifractor plautii]|uniref:Arc-like DNA binding domain-containing protein n=1 Tax=Flavonifractor plautii 1_3_50AFAA TaxID=742738 RepID=A0A096D525_FLAPL|nr:hypothetical protein [Flavonifractor plautii]KGF52634.1 hypothetical protein HMPREF9460_03972 [Flavonifractor plautii 1_3_50AFAA]MCI7153194.1 hypothetical protein [Flavonifractor plautii]MDY3701207.1 hypothetical protein [Flavonifractor plautii]